MNIVDPKDLTVLSVMQNDSGLGKYMVKSVNHFTTPKPNIIICDNGGQDKMLNDVVGANDNVRVVKNTKNINHSNTSVRHGTGLDLITPMVKTKYTAIVESDVVVLSDKWYHLDVQHKLKAKWKGNRAGEDYWFVCFLVFETELFKGMIWCNDKNIRGYLNRPREQQPYNDVGWGMHDRVSDKSIIKDLQTKRCNIGAAKYFDKRFSHKSFEMWEDDEPICAHFWRGSDLGRTTNPVGDWKKICDRILQ